MLSNKERKSPIFHTINAQMNLANKYRFFMYSEWYYWQPYQLRVDRSLPAAIEYNDVRYPG